MGSTGRQGIQTRIAIRKWRAAHEPALTGRAAELAAELQAASDALLAGWRSERLARAKAQQQELPR
jgi:hypothetical protein